MLEAEVGFNGYFVPNAWTPLRTETVADTSFDGVLTVDVTNAANLVRTFRFPMRFVAGARHQFFADVVIPDPRYPLVFRVLRGADEVARTTIPLGNSRAVDGIVVVLAREAAGLEFLKIESGRLRPAYLGEEALPIRWQSYEGVRAVVIRDLDDTRLQEQQRQALREWVGQGGHLIVTSSDLLRNAQPQWLMPLLPGVPQNERTSDVVMLGPEVVQSVPIVPVSPRAGAVAQPNRVQPQLLDWSYGRGTVTLWTFDALASTIRTSPVVVRHWQRMLTAPRISPIATRALADILPTTPVLPGIAQVGVTLSVVIYIVMLRRVLPRAGTRRGWVVLSITVLAAGALLYGAAAAARSSVPAVTQVSLIEAIPDVGLARVTTYVGATTPFGGALELVAPARATIRPMSGSAINQSHRSSTLEAPAPLRRGTFEILQAIPLAVRGTASRTPMGLRLEIENPDGVPIGDPVLYLDGQIYRLPDIRAHTTLVLDLTQGAPVDRLSARRDALAERLRQWTVVRLGADAIIKRDRPSLIGWVDDARLTVRAPRIHQGSTVSLLVVPLAPP